jgi:hypothetical protein
MKTLAETNKKEIAIIVRDQKGSDLLIFTILPYGSNGHKWALKNDEYFLSIGNWMEPQSRPSIMIHIHSETLWRFGPQEAIERLLYALAQNGAEIKSVKPSRIDLCVDIVFPEKLWGLELIKYKVSKSRKESPELQSGEVTGLIFGKGGKIVGRMYDKPLEIIQKSKKFWMYDIWEVDSVPDGYKIIRIESQFRRESIKQLGLESITNFFECIDNLWAYFTNDWLSFKDNPGKHHTQRNIFTWWIIVQGSFFGVQGAKPLVRCKSLNTKEKQFFCQAYGLLTTLTAMRLEKMDADLRHEVTIDYSLKIFKELTSFFGKQDFEFNTDVLDKRQSYNKSVQKMLEVSQQRKILDQPCNLTTENLIKEKGTNQQWKNILQHKN